MVFFCDNHSFIKFQSSRLKEKEDEDAMEADGESNSGKKHFLHHSAFSYLRFERHEGIILIIFVFFYPDKDKEKTTGNDKEEADKEKTEDKNEKDEDSENKDDVASSDESIPDAGALDDEEDSDFDPNDDPEKLWCFCKKPHDNRYYN